MVTPEDIEPDPSEVPPNCSFPPSLDSGKCIHGGPDDGWEDTVGKQGINKDSPSIVISPHNYLHAQAAAAAIQATSEFLGLIHTRLANANGPDEAQQEMALLLGVDGLTVSDTGNSSSFDLNLSLTNSVNLGGNLEYVSLGPGQTSFPAGLPDVLPGTTEILTVYGTYSSDPVGYIFYLLQLPSNWQFVSVYSVVNGADTAPTSLSGSTASGELILNQNNMPDIVIHAIDVYTIQRVSEVSPDAQVAKASASSSLQSDTSSATSVTPYAVGLLSVTNLLTGVPVTNSVPVDSTITSVNFLVNPTNSIVIIQPDGTMLNTNASNVIVATGPDGIGYTVNTPELGNWRVIVNGTGPLTLNVTALATLDFSYFRYVMLGGRAGHEGYYPLPGYPTAGESNTVDALLTPGFATANFSFVSPAGGVLQNFSLTELWDPATNEFLGYVVVPQTSFLVYADGTDTNGYPYQRYFPGITAAQTVAVIPPTAQDLYPGTTTNYVFAVSNVAATATFQVSASDNQGWITNFQAISVSLNQNQATNITVELLTPTNAVPGMSDSLTVSAANAATTNFATVLSGVVIQPVQCDPVSYTISSSSATFTASGGMGGLSVSAGSNCAWAATSNVPWVTIVGAVPGIGNGVLVYSVDPNSSLTELTGTLTIAGQTFTVSEAAFVCDFTLDWPSASFLSGGGSNSVAVTANATNCPWMATSNNSFITITSGSNGVGNGVVTYSVTTNATASPLVSTMIIAGESFTVTVYQAGAPCAFALNATNATFNASGGTNTVNVMAPTGCAWTAVSNNGFVTITGGTNGNGNGTVSYSVAPSTSTDAVTSTMTIAGQTFTVYEAGVVCIGSLTPGSQVFSNSGGSSSVTVSTPDACSWTATSNNGFINITSGSTGSGTGTVSYTVSPNANVYILTGTMTIAGQIFTITEFGTGSPELVLDSFSSSNPTNPYNAQSGLVQGCDGYFYGTSINGGTRNQGTVYRVDSVGNITVLWQFGSTNTAGVNPWVPLVLGRDGNFYGTTKSGGSNNMGTIYQLIPNGTNSTLTTLWQFGSLGNDADGAYPFHGLVQGRDGNFYGTAPDGGVYGDGTVYQLIPNGTNSTLNPLWEFGSMANDADGSDPQAGLIQGADGYFYGTSYSTVFKISTVPGSLITMYQGSGVGLNGFYGLVQGRDGKLYGTTAYGGTQGAGTVFQIATNGTSLNWSYSFGPVPPDGDQPEAPLVQCSDGNFYGTTELGGTKNEGTVFRIGPSGPATYTSLYSFLGTPDGAQPQTPLMQGSDGNFYGTTQEGGTGGDGTVYRIDVGLGPVTPTSTFAVSPTNVMFTAAGGTGAVSVVRLSGCGSWTAASTNSWITITSGSSGTVSGTVSYTVAANTSPNTLVGTITVAGQTVTILQPSSSCTYSLGSTSASFGVGGGTSNVTVSASVTNCPWIAVSNNGFISITSGSSGTGNGAVSYSVAANTSSNALTGTVTIADQTFTVTEAGVTCAYSITPTNQTVTFSAAGGTGSFTVTMADACSWTAASTNSFITITSGNGSGVGNSTVNYSVAPNTSSNTLVGTLVIAGQSFTIVEEGSPELGLDSFSSSNPTNPFNAQSSLVQGCDGDFYGTSSSGGTNAAGTVYRVDTAGNITVLWQFGSTNTAGVNPWAALMLGRDGNFYGTTERGGSNNLGTIYQFIPNGTASVVNTLWQFGSLGNDADGEYPFYGLVQGRDGNFYGTAADGGVHGVGTVYQLIPNGTNSTLNPLWEFGSLPEDADGSGPQCALVQGTDGYFYGTSWGSTSDVFIGGTVFKIGSVPGSLSVMYQFPSENDGGTLVAVQPYGLVQGSDGNLYGVTRLGGTNCYLGSCGIFGTIFQIATNGTSLNWSYSFGVPPDGGEPEAPLVQGSDGNFYGTTAGDGAHGYGTVFRIGPGGPSTYTSLYSFLDTPDGAQPQTPLMQGSDGNFYGTTQEGGTGGDGTVYRIDVGLSPLSPTFAVSPSNATFAATGGTGSFTVNTSGPCPWTVTGNNGFITITSGSSGSGTGTVSYAVASNPTTIARIGTITVFDQTVVVVQLGSTDSVGDGIANNWRAQYFGSGTTTNSLSCASCDADGTGQDNLFKYVAGLNPTSAVSVFEIDAVKTPGHSNQFNVLYGPIVAGHSYTPQYTTNLVSGVWLPLTGYAGPTTNGSQAMITDLNATQTRKFYRIDIALLPATDSVGDGIPDWWRAEYFAGLGTNTNSVSCATCDPDGDGMNNLQEYLTKTDPTNSASYFHITRVVQTNNNVLVTWMTGIGITNVLQVSSGTNGSYTSSFTDIFTVTNTVGTITNYLDVGGATNKPARYYRIHSSVSCSYTIGPSNQTFSATGGNGSITVSSPGGCSWTVASNSGFLAITSGSSGTGNGIVTYSVASNPSTIPRIGTLTIGGQTFVVVQTGSTDGVGDGIANSWRAEYFGSATTTNAQSCATCDADGTGQDNLFKYVAGLDPTNRASVFVLEPAATPGQPNQFSLLFHPIAAGRSYTPQYTTDLVSGVWLPLTGYAGPVTNGSQVMITDLNAIQTTKFYRIDIQLLRAPDSVGDGIPDWWRAEYFGGVGTSTNTVSCAACDPDGDGMNNLQEYLTGTDPTNSASYFHITSVVQSNNNVLVTWMTGIGITNVLQVSSGAAGSYTTNFTDIFTVTNTVGTITNYLDVGAATNRPARYYRVRLGP